MQTDPNNGYTLHLYMGKRLGHNNDATTRTYILNNQGKQKTSRQIINALSQMNGSDVLMGTQTD